MALPGGREDIRELAAIPADRLHRLPAAARRRHGRHGGPERAIPGQRTARLPAEEARGGRHPQPRLLVPRRHRGLRLSAGKSRQVQVGLRADTDELRRLAPGQRNQPTQHRCRIPLQRTRQTRHPRRHHGAPAGRQTGEDAQPHRGNPEAETTRGQRGLVGLPLRRDQAPHTDRTVWHDLHGAPAGQRAHLQSPGAADRGGTGMAGERSGQPLRLLPHHPLQRLQILHALPLRTEHTGHTAPLQQMRERRQRAREPAGRELP